MTATRHAKDLARERADRAIARQKDAYRQKIESIQQAFDPPLSNAELAAGLDVDVAPEGRSGHSDIGRWVSTSPRLRRARPDALARAMIDAVLEGDLLIAVERSHMPGSRREVLICDERDVRHLSRIFDLRNLGGGDLPERPSEAGDWDGADWNLFGGDAPPEVAATSPKPPVKPMAASPIMATQLSQISGAMPQRLVAGRQVGAVGLGAMRLSTDGRPSDADAVNVLHAAFNAGMTLVDTADSYALDDSDLGHNERLIARAISSWGSSRDDLLIATKAGLRRPGGRWIPDASPRHLRTSCEASLANLGVEALDLFQLHVIDAKVPLADSVGELATLRDEGKIRHVGLSNIKLEQLEEARAIVDIASVQNACSYVDKASLEKGLVERCHALGIAFLAHSPIGGHRGVTRTDRHKALRAVASRHGASARQVALAWLLHLAPGIVTLAGATSVATIDASASATQLELTEQDLEQLAASRRGFARELRPRLWSFAETFVPTSQHRVREGTEGEGTKDEGSMVMFVGPPAAGKTDQVSSFVEQGYERLNRDVIGGRLDDLLPIAERVVKGGQRYLVLDNTYPTRRSRQPMLELARRHGLDVTCVWLDVPIEEALFNACLRMLDRHGRILGPSEIKSLSKDDPNMLPPAAIYRYFQLFEPPQIDEGFATIDRVPFERRSQDYDQRALILDYDGTLRRSTGPAPFPLHPDQVEILPGRKEVLDQHVADGWLLLGLSNQSGIAKGQLSDEVARACFTRTNELLGHNIDVRYSPYATTGGGVWSRKPMPGLGVQLIEEYKLDRSQCVMVGDLESDRELAKNCGFTYAHAADFFVDSADD